MNGSAHDYPEVYAALGIEVSKLGCIMADVDQIPVTEMLSEGIMAERYDPAADLYVSSHPDRTWINGAVGEHGAHVTLLYGLLNPGPELRPLVDAVLEGLVIDTVTVDHVGLFPSPYPEERYQCVVAHLKLTPELVAAHARLSYLPHVNTFPDYKAHVTLAYVKDEESSVWKGNSSATLWQRYLDQQLRGRTLSVTGLNYGRDMRA